MATMAGRWYVVYRLPAIAAGDSADLSNNLGGPKFPMVRPGLFDRWADEHAPLRPLLGQTVLNAPSPDSASKFATHYCYVQCYAWTESEYKFTCVSVTLSVNSPTGQTPQRIFTVDSLKDADLRKDVPFEGLNDE